MKKAGSGHREEGARTPVRRRPKRFATAIRRVTGAASAVRTGAVTFLDRVPGTVRATRVGANDATSALQTLPDSTLRWLAAGSVGLGAGLFLAGAPRVVIAAGVAPALAMGAAALARPSRPVDQADVTPLKRPIGPRAETGRAG